MAEAATPTKADLSKRRTIAKRLLSRERKIAKILRLIDEDKDALRELSDAAGAGFNVEIDGFGTVEVKARRQAELTGTSPAIVTEAYYALPETQQKKLIEDGVVEIV